MPVNPAPASPDQPVDPAEWRIAPALPAAKLGGALVLLIAGLVFADGDPVKPILAGIVAAALAAWGVRDLLVPVRLRITPTGPVVASGLAGRRELPWSRIDRIRVTSGQRLGLRAETLEIDCDDSIHVFTRADLDADPRDVAAVLQEAQRRAATGQG